ncbi:hypothetical protein HH303_05765 [Rhodospirillaceae bacterium KN72]|uniref:Uncharacterized protein n=1 Tax=Pacificispira spongiicola TaxID=2729598 RepID=A0A7Y0HEW2_9PROT|nr:hypothetical protein [Pacificispira spongiicola]NMM43973.1 hypothetical protein [Pacificispira spongiicola]
MFVLAGKLCRRPSILLALSVALAVLLLNLAQAFADDRDRGLESVRTLTQELLIRTRDGSATDRQIWAGVQGVTDALNRFRLAETEIRAGEKVAPPAITSLRPGEAAPPENMTPGDRKPLDDVPTPWFNRQITLAQEAVGQLRTALEQDKPRPELANAMRAVLDHLAAVDRPPNS